MELVGGKAHNLGRAIHMGLDVPDGFVLTAPALDVHLERSMLRGRIESACATVAAADAGGRAAAARSAALMIREMIVTAALPPAVIDTVTATAARLLRGGPVVVRSSAIGEDSARESFAGQLDSFLHIRTEAALVQAVLDCWASCWSERALAYRASRGLTARGMGVVVQRQVDARHAGVMFTTTSDDLVLVEFTAGLGDALVAGEIDPGRIVMNRDGSGVRSIARGSGEPILPPGSIADLARIATTLERGFGAPQDVEWAIDANDDLFLVQTRPITAPLRALPVSDERPTVHWSNANVNENFPAPISPLLYSIAAAGYAHYFRNLARAFGMAPRRIAAMDDALRHVIGVHGARMYYNLTSVHTILRSAPFGDEFVAAFNRFVGTSGSEGTAAAPPAKGWRARASEWAELLGVGVRTTWTYLFFGRRVAQFERMIDDFAARTHPSHLDRMSLRDLRVSLAELMEIRCHRWTNAGLADAAAMTTYASLHRLVNRAYGGAAPGSLHNSLLKAIPGLVSGEPVHRLWELSRLVRGSPALRALFDSDTPVILTGVRSDPRFAEFRAEFEEYLERWGFRCSAELMLTVPSFQEDPSALIDTIRSYSRLGGESPAESLARQLAARREETRDMLRAMRWRPVFRSFPIVTYAPVLAVVLRWTQASIGFRERARLKQALLYSRCRRIVLALGDRLVDRGLLARSDDVFWLTVPELDELASGIAMLPADVRALVELRHAAHARAASLSFPDSFTTHEGEYLVSPPAPRIGENQTPITNYQLHHTGTGACGGRVTGRAAVLGDVGEASRIVPGDVLVTRQTDPGWAPVFFLISGLVIERGGMLSHGAIVAREFGIPCVVGVQDATRLIPEGRQVAVDGDRGEVHVLA
jgi:pyruvate,water dikinase